MMEDPGRPAAALQSAVTGMIAALLDRRDAVLTALTEVATYDSAADEMQRSIRVLAGAPWEIRRNAPRELSLVTAFLPSNNVLYSYTLFCLVPALYSRQVVGRPSARVRAVTQRLHTILGDLAEERVSLTGTSQREFVEVGAGADAVIFTGQPENGRRVMAAVGRGPTVLAFGSGPNPFVVGPEADVDAVADDLVAARLYNSGQDCLCPDVTFVHASVADQLVENLCAATVGLTLGDRRDPATRIAPLVYEDAVRQAADFIAGHRDQVRSGGRVDVHTGVVQPTVARLPWRDGFVPPEFFSPVFCVVSYDDSHQLVRWFTSPVQQDRGMYVSVYGEPGLPHGTVGTTVICRNQTTFDVEDGNRPFGGYGPAAGCAQVDGVVTGRPLLLSAEMRAAVVPLAGRAA